MENLRALTAALKSRKEAVHIAEKVGLCTVEWNSFILIFNYLRNLYVKVLHAVQSFDFINIIGASGIEKM